MRDLQVRLPALCLFRRFEGVRSRCRRTDIANGYLHCLGCELLAKKDYNICVSCFQADKWKQNVVLGRADAGPVPLLVVPSVMALVFPCSRPTPFPFPFPAS